MSLDLNDILRDWPHDPGQLTVRKIVGSDGKEKLQLRIDLGLMQMEMTGRPDGQRPFDCESLLAYHRQRAAEKEAAGEEYSISAEEFSELQHEGIQYYHRYVSLFQLNDFLGVIRDTQRNLDLLNFAGKYVEGAELRSSLEQFQPHVLMMNTRARASIELDREDYEAAIRQIERGRSRIAAIFEDDEAASRCPEIAFLDEWLEEIRAKRPLSKREALELEMKEAIACEAYERAAELRDALRAYAAQGQEK